MLEKLKVSFNANLIQKLYSKELVKTKMLNVAVQLSLQLEKELEEWNRKN